MIIGGIAMLDNRRNELLGIFTGPVDTKKAFDAYRIAHEAYGLDGYINFSYEELLDFNSVVSKYVHNPLCMSTVSCVVNALTTISALAATLGLESAAQPAIDVYDFLCTIAQCSTIMLVRCIENDTTAWEDKFGLRSNISPELRTILSEKDLDIFTMYATEMTIIKELVVYMASILYGDEVKQSWESLITVRLHDYIEVFLDVITIRSMHRRDHRGS